jgi:hypothetical protein
MRWEEVSMPKAPYTIKLGDLLFINVSGTEPDQPIQGVWLVEPSGTVALGLRYGRAKVEGLTLEGAEQAIKKKLHEDLRQPEVSVTLAGWIGPRWPGLTPGPQSTDHTGPYIPPGRKGPPLPKAGGASVAEQLPRETGSNGREGSELNADPLISSRAAEMRTIILAALEYATEHPQWPKTLDELKQKYLDVNKLDLGEFDYYPMSAESAQKNPRDVAVLAVKKRAFASGRLIGFADGYVEFIRDPEQLKRLFPTETGSLPASQEKKE